MPSLNRVMLSGNFKAPLKLIESNYGNFGTFTLITTDEWYDSASKSKKEKTNEINITVYSEDAVNKLSNASNMAQIVLEGQVKTKSFTNAKGFENTITEIVIPKFNAFVVVSDPIKSNNNSNQTKPSNSNQQTYRKRRIIADDSFDINDDIPF